MSSISWLQVELAVLSIAEQIKSRTNSPPIHSIVAIGRGGMIPAAMLAHRLGVKTTDYINYSRMFGLQCDTLSRFLRNEYKNLLLIDDVTETGGTFRALCRHYEQKTPDIEDYRTAVLFSTHDPEAHINFIGTKYIPGEVPIMPWEGSMYT